MKKKISKRFTQGIAIAACGALCCSALVLGGCGGGNTTSTANSSASAPAASAPAASAESSSAAETSAAETSSESSSEVTLDDIEGMMTSAYAGQNKDSGEYYYWASDDDGTFVMLAIYNEDSKTTASYVGQAEVNGNNVTVTDFATGNKIGFDISQNDDGTYTLDLGDEYGKATVEETSTSDVFKAFENLDQYTTAVDPNGK